jgi:hypothetical protein
MTKITVVALAVVALSVLALVPAVAGGGGEPEVRDPAALEALSASALTGLGRVEFATDLIQ